MSHNIANMGICFAHIDGVECITKDNRYSILSLPDFDQDGIDDFRDTDIDGDSVLNDDDAHPIDAYHWIDTITPESSTHSSIESLHWRDADPASLLNRSLLELIAEDDVETMYMMDADHDYLHDAFDHDDDNDGLPDHIDLHPDLHLFHHPVSESAA
jgi:hypothetical protein